MLLLQGCGCSSVVEVWQQAKLLLKTQPPPPPLTTAKFQTLELNTSVVHVYTEHYPTMKMKELRSTTELFWEEKHQSPKAAYDTILWTKKNQTINEEQEIKGVRRKGCNYKRDPWVTLVATDMLFMAISMLLFCHWR